MQRALLFLVIFSGVLFSCRTITETEGAAVLSNNDCSQLVPRGQCSTQKNSAGHPLSCACADQFSGDDNQQARLATYDPSRGLCFYPAGCGSQNTASTCSVGGRTFQSGQSWPDADGCNTCTCNRGSVSCTEIACGGDRRSCTSGGRTYADGRSWPDADGCNTCTCRSGSISCTELACGGQTGSCRVAGRTYVDGQTWPDSDGCNTCSCSGGSYTCTELPCRN